MRSVCVWGGGGGGRAGLPVFGYWEREGDGRGQAYLAAGVGNEKWEGGMEGGVGLPVFRYWETEGDGRGQAYLAVGVGR